MQEEHRISSYSPTHLTNFLGTRNEHQVPMRIRCAVGHRSVHIPAMRSVAIGPDWAIIPIQSNYSYQCADNIRNNHCLTSSQRRLQFDRLNADQPRILSCQWWHCKGLLTPGLEFLLPRGAEKAMNGIGHWATYQDSFVLGLFWHHWVTFLKLSQWPMCSIDDIGFFSCPSPD